MTKLVFISGIFNVLHPGHIRLFKFASEIGTRLVIGVLDDELTSRQFNSEQDRLNAVSAISLIDEVLLVSDLNSTIETLRPDIIVKGSEFRHRNNPEEALLARWQGRLVFSSGASQFSIPNLTNGDNRSNQFPDSYVKFANRHSIDCKSLIANLEKLKNLKVAVVGDIILDEYIDCDPVGLSREDPTVVVTPKSKQTFIGGAAIVAAHTKSFGADVDFYSVSGADKQAEWLKSKMAEHGVNTFIFEDDSRPTTRKTRYRSLNKSLLRVNEFRTHGIQREIQEKFLLTFERNYSNYDLIVFSDFSYGVLTPDFARELLAMSHAKRIPVIADSQTSSQRGDLNKFSDLLLSTPTEVEARLAADIEDQDIGLAFVIEALAKKLNVKNVMITLGADGALILDAKDKHSCAIDSLPALNKNPMDVAGAGDLVLISSGLLLASGCDIWHASLVGMMAASIHIGRVGNTPIDIQELIEMVGQFELESKQR